MSRAEFWKNGGGPMRQIQVGDIALANGEFVSPEEYERRQAALTPAQRELQQVIGANFAGIAKALREAHEELKREGR